MWTTRTIADGDETIVLLPDEVSLGVDVDVIITRVGDVVTVRKATLEEIDGSPEPTT